MVLAHRLTCSVIANLYDRRMADDVPWFSSDYSPPVDAARQSRRTLVWTLIKRGRRVEAELLDHGQHGVEVQFLHEGLMAYARRWRSRALALAEADDERVRLMRDGWKEPPGD